MDESIVEISFGYITGLILGVSRADGGVLAVPSLSSNTASRKLPPL